MTKRRPAVSIAKSAMKVLQSLAEFHWLYYIMSRLPCHQCGLNEEVILEEGSSVAVVQLSGLSAEEI